MLSAARAAVQILEGCVDASVCSYRTAYYVFLNEAGAVHVSVLLCPCSTSRPPLPILPLLIGVCVILAGGRNRKTADKHLSSWLTGQPSEGLRAVPSISRSPAGSRVVGQRYLQLTPPNFLHPFIPLQCDQNGKQGH